MLSDDTRSIFTWLGASVIVAFLIWAVSDFDRRMKHYTCDATPMTVSYRDTLYDIATKNCEGNVNYAIDDLVDKYGTNIQIGQVIQLETK